MREASEAGYKCKDKMCEFYSVSYVAGLVVVIWPVLVSLLRRVGVFYWLSLMESWAPSVRPKTSGAYMASAWVGGKA